MVFAGVLSLLEWLRGHILTGFPWNLPGETWRAGSAVSQAASALGAYGLTWVTLAIAAAPALWREGRKGWAAIGAAAIALAGLWAWGAARLSTPPPPARTPIVRIVQANVPEADKYLPGNYRPIVARYAELTRRLAERRPDIVIWPEGAIPDALDGYLLPGSWAYDQIMAALQPGQALLVGGYRAQSSPQGTQYFNTLAAVRRTAGGLQPLARYDKYRLVPFGEYIPLDQYLAPLGLHQLVQVGEGFSPGPRPRPLVAAGLPVMQPLICYESLFPGFTRDGARASGQQPSVILNVSNDAWFGATSGPLQHLNLAAYRAIEEGLPLVRATPTGVSAVVDAYGRVMAGDSLSHGSMGIIDAPIPPPLRSTIYRRIGDLLFALLMSFSALIALMAVYPPLRQSRRNPIWGGKA